MSARIWPGVGKVLGSTRLSGFHRSDRTMARAHWSISVRYGGVILADTLTVAVNRFKQLDRRNDRHCRSPDSRARERDLLAASIALDDLHKLPRMVLDAADIGDSHVRRGFDIVNGAAEPVLDLPVAAPRPRGKALGENI